MSVIPFRSRDDQFYRYIGVNFTFGLLDCDLYIGNIVIPWLVKPGFCSTHYAVTLAGLKNVNRYIGNIALSKIVISGFHCNAPPVFRLAQRSLNLSYYRYYTMPDKYGQLHRPSFFLD